MDKARLFVDMDGTLAEFKISELEELYTPGYFAVLEPQQSVVDAVRLICQTHQEIDVYVLSAVLPDSVFATLEKNAWLDEHLPELDIKHRIFLPCGKEKVAFVPDGVGPNDFLLDDFTANLDDWSQQGGHGIKLLNGINHTRGSWKGNQLRCNKESGQLSLNLIEIVQKKLLIKDTKPLSELEAYTAAMDQAGYEPVNARHSSYDFLMWKNRLTGQTFGLDGIEGVADFLAKSVKRLNEGYEIVQTVEAANKSFVMGQNNHAPSQFVTWRQFDNGYEWGHYFGNKLDAQKDLLNRALDSLDDGIAYVQGAPAAEDAITQRSEHISIDGHEGTWYTIGCENINGVDYYLMEHEKYGDEAAGVIVDSEGKVICEDIWNGFDDLADFLPESMSAAEQDAYIRDMKPPRPMSEHEQTIYSTLIDLQAGRAIDAHEAKYGVAGFHAFPGSFDCEPEL